MDSVSLLDAFVAGALSFVSLSVLPLILGYAAFIAGVHGVRVPAKRHVGIMSLCFVLGFSLVFVSLGASGTVAGQFMLQQSTLFRQIAGVLLIIFGLHTIGVFKVNPRPAGMIGAIIGSAFAFGWTPTIGPTLAGIFAVASQPLSVNQGIALLSIYALGLAIPLLLAALAIHECFVAVKNRRHSHTIVIAAGIVIIITGVLIFTNRFTFIFSSY